MLPNVLLTGLISFLITILAIPVIMRVADEKKLFDLPDARKLHSRPIASLGGVGIFIGFSLAILLSAVHFINAQFNYLFASAFVIFFLGLKDDILILSPVKKFLGQMAAAAIIIHLGGLRIESMYGILGINELPYVISVGLTYATIIVTINAFNLIDGVDGLSGSLGVLTMSVFGTYFILAQMPAFAFLAFSMAGSLIAFLYFNAHPAKIFMGDSDSLFLGLMNSILVIKFLSVAGSQSAFPLPSSVAIAFSILIVPLLDTLRVFSIRIARGRSPFSPDRNHIHHLLLDLGLNHRQVTLSCLSLNVIFIILAYTARNIGSTWLLLGMTGLSYAMVGILYVSKRKETRPSVSSMVMNNAFSNGTDSILQPAPKMVSLKNEPVEVE